MAIKPGLARAGRTSTKNPPFFSHEFVIQNHADIVSCVAMVFVVGLMVPATSSLASIFIALHHNLTGADPSQENPRGIPYTYETGWKDWCAVFFYTLISVIMHAVIQEYGVDKLSKRLHLSKLKLARFNDSAQLIVFYVMSFLWGVDVMLREGYFANGELLWAGFPAHPMIFLHKLYFIIQLAYYLHMLPELYFQKVKRDEQTGKIVHALVGVAFVALGYFGGFQRLALVLLTLHSFGEFLTQLFVMVEIFDRDEVVVGQLSGCLKISFAVTRIGTMVLAILSLYYGLEDTEYAVRGAVALFAVCTLQGQLAFRFFRTHLANKRLSSASAAAVAESSGSASKASKKSAAAKKDRKRESDLPEADQQEAAASSSVSKAAKKVK